MNTSKTSKNKLRIINLSKYFRENAATFAQQHNGLAVLLQVAQGLPVILLDYP